MHLLLYDLRLSWKRIHLPLQRREERREGQRVGRTERIEETGRETIMPSRQMLLVTHLKENAKQDRSVNGGLEKMWGGDEEGRGGWRRLGGWDGGVDGGVVASCNKFNLNPKLTRCCDCRVLKIWRNNQRQQKKKKIKHRLLFTLSLSSGFSLSLSRCLCLCHWHKQSLPKRAVFYGLDRDKVLCTHPWLMWCCNGKQSGSTQTDWTQTHTHTPSQEN